MDERALPVQRDFGHLPLSSKIGKIVVAVTLRLRLRLRELNLNFSLSLKIVAEVKVRKPHTVSPMPFAPK